MTFHLFIFSKNMLMLAWKYVRKFICLPIIRAAIAVKFTSDRNSTLSNWCCIMELERTDKFRYNRIKTGKWHKIHDVSVSVCVKWIVGGECISANSKPFSHIDLSILLFWILFLLTPAVVDAVASFTDFPVIVSFVTCSVSTRILLL